MYSKDWLAKAIRDVHLKLELDITLIIFLRHLHKVHKKFFMSATEDVVDNESQFLDTKFYVSKLKNEVFACPEILSFEQILNASAGETLDNSVYGQLCDRFNLGKT